jgi:hypothetical protein
VGKSNLANLAGLEHRLFFTNTVVSNLVNSDHVSSFSCLDVWTNRHATSGVYANYFQCRDNYVFKIQFVLFLYLLLSVYHEMKTICLYIFLISHIYWGTEHQCLFRGFLIWRTKITKFWRNGNDSKQPYWPVCFTVCPYWYKHSQ